MPSNPCRIKEETDMENGMEIFRYRCGLNYHCFGHDCIKIASLSDNFDFACLPVLVL